LLAARLRVTDAMNRLLDEHTRSMFNIDLRDDVGMSMLASGDGAERRACCDVAETVNVLNERWQLKAWPTAAFLTRIPMNEAWRAMFAMFVVGVLSALGVWQTMLHRRRTLAHARAIEALHEIAVAIAAAPEQSRELLGRLTHVIADMLKMPMCLFNVFDARDQTITVVHHVGAFPQPRKRVFDLRNLPSTVEAFRTGRPVYAEDVETARGPFARPKLQQDGIRSLLVLPLMLRGEPVGSISLSDNRPHKLTSNDLRLAQLWASHAASIVASSELQRRTDQALRAQKQLLEQRETLYRVNTEIQKANSLSDALQRVADLAPEALDVDVCAVALPAAAPAEFTIASVSSGDSSFREFAGAVVRCAHAFFALKNGSASVVEDARSDPHISQYGLPIGSAVYLPLATSTGTLGVLALYRREPSSYTQEQMHFAELFAMRAAVVIENSRLLEQTRRDADAKAILLRELNHRVKNNLAGIVGLLSTSPVSLPAESRRWLDRVIDRIDSMSRVHELFVDGSIAVSAPELIRRSLEPVIAMCPPGVSVKFDLEGDEVRLLTNHAVTLAMVLHELCFNALQHGVGESGSIVIRSRVDEQCRMTVEVIDDGGGLAPVPSSGEGGVAVASILRPARMARRTGIGLNLVKGLVRRELRGEFDLSPRSQGGTIAKITFSGDERRAV
jgi:two-component sensor histidine kinase